jgi:hypothetical protein
MNKPILRAILFAVTWLTLFSISGKVFAAYAPTWWEVQSVDTMKYSRDTSGQYLENPSKAKLVINQQVSQVAAVNATHVAIATPYDAKFLPILKLWVESARRHGLKIWFRGNFSGWEGWFDFSKIDRTEHLKLTKEFILANPELFEDGDIFSPCPECENGGPGDPRATRDIEGHRLFLISEHQEADKAFGKIGKKVSTKFNSMNGDVARIIMDPKTTKALGGIVVVDHYVANPKKLISDLQEIQRLSDGDIFLGETGVPIPDINGQMSEGDQAKWIKEALSELAQMPRFVGLNYWTSVGGSTQIWEDGGRPKEAVAVLQDYFLPKTINGNVSFMNKPIIGAKITTSEGKMALSDKKGDFIVPRLGGKIMITFSSPGYIDQTVIVDETQTGKKISLSPNTSGWLGKIVFLVKRLLGL